MARRELTLHSLNVPFGILPLGCNVGHIRLTPTEIFAALCSDKMAYAPQLDTIYLRNLKISAVIGPDAWGRQDKAQPVVLNIRLKIDTTTSSTSDDINDTFSYGQMSKEITSQLDGKVFNNLQHLITVLTTFAAFWPGEDTKLQALAPKALLRVEGGLEISHSIRKKDRYEENGVPQVRHVDTRSWSIKGLKLACIIGVNKHERLQKQNVNVDLRIPAIDPRTFDAKEGSSENWRTLVNRVCEVIEYSSFETLEALAGRIAKTALDGFPVQEITVSVEKPSALTFVEGAGVEITRRKEAYADRPDTSAKSSEVSRPRMTLDQFQRTQAREEAAPKPGYPPMHQAPTIQQYRDMKRQNDGSETPIASSSRSGVPPSPRTVQQRPETPIANHQRRSSRNAAARSKPISHSVSQSADSGSYYIDGSIDQATSPKRSHDAAAGKRPDILSPGGPSSPQSYLNGQYDFETAARPFSPTDPLPRRHAPHDSESSSMFGAVPSRSNFQGQYAVDGSAETVLQDMPGSYADTPKPAKGDAQSATETPNADEPVINRAGTSYFDSEGELKDEKKAGSGNGGDSDVSI
ncbi:MAG: hypothetical protein Q9174_005541 [Haloplaca sp. 1 TL-2023]